MHSNTAHDLCGLVVNTEMWVQVPHLLLVWKSLWFSLSLSFLICKLGDLISTYHVVSVRSKWDYCVKLEECPAEVESQFVNCCYLLHGVFPHSSNKNGPPWTHITVWLYLSFSALEETIPVWFISRENSQNSNSEIWIIDDSYVRGRKKKECRRMMSMVRNMHLLPATNTNRNRLSCWSLKFSFLDVKDRLAMT